MFFNLVTAALFTSLSVSAATVPVTPDQLPSLTANGTKFIIASGLYGSELNVAHGTTDDGNPVIVYRADTASAINQQVSLLLPSLPYSADELIQWLITNVITSSPNTYTIQSAADPQPYLTYPLAILQPNTAPSSIDSPAVVSNSCTPIEFTIEQIKTGANGY